MSLTLSHVLTNRAAIRKAKRDLTKTTLPVLAAYPVILPDMPQPVPLVLVDAAKRPDVADLVRVHQLEGDGDIETRWRYYLSQSFAKAVLDVEMSAPVRTSFALCFDLTEHFEALADMAEAGTLVMTTSTPTMLAGVNVRHPSLGLHCPQDDLTQALRAHAVVETARASASVR